MNKNIQVDSYPMLENYLFGTVKLTKYLDIDQYKHSGYGIGFERKRYYSTGNEIDRNILIFGVDMSSSSHIDNIKRNISLLGKGPTQGLEHRMVAEKLYSTKSTKHCAKSCLSWHYNGANSYLFVNGTEIIEFKAKYSEILKL